MSSIDEAIDALFLVLEEERAAIRRVDARAVEQAAQRKETIAAQLAEHTPADLAGHVTSLTQLRSELRRNGILLAHARSCLQQAVDLLHPRRGDARSGTLRTSM